MKTIDIFNNKMPSVVGGIIYMPRTTKQFTFKDDFEPNSFYDYYSNFGEIDDVLSTDGLSEENPVIDSIEEAPAAVEAETPVSTPSGSTTPTKISTPTLTYSRSLLSGQHQFKKSGIDVGHLQEFLDLLAKNNIFVRVTSGIRPGAITSSGNRSRHDDGHAIDITPIKGETWEDLVSKIKNNKEVLEYMVAHNVGWLEEISEEDRKKYDATNANVHISIAGDRGYGEASAINGRKKVFGV